MDKGSFSQMMSFGMCAVNWLNIAERETTSKESING